MIVSYETLKTLFGCQLSLEELTACLTAQGLEVEQVIASPDIEKFHKAQVVSRTEQGYVLAFDEQQQEIATHETLESDVDYVIDNTQGHWSLTTPESLGWGSGKRPLSVPSKMSIAKAWEWDDCLIELSVTPNRGDCLSYLGVVREIFLAQKQSFDHQQWLKKMKAQYPAEFEEKTELQVSVDPEIAHFYGLMQVSCPRFQSPFWLQRFLIKHGLQPKLPAVDVGHYWMMMLGLPSHAFDAVALSGKISLKKHNFEQPISWQGLQGSPLQLSGTLPVICDEQQQILCLPGAMGGAESASHEDSQRLVIEAAYFLPSAIRPYRACVPVTASSLRFERGVWRSGQRDLLELIAGLLCSLHPQVRCAEPAVSYEQQWEAPVLTTTQQQVEKIAGMAFSQEQFDDVLNFMGAELKDGVYHWQIPDWRFDLSLEQNFIGEIIRCYGLDSLQQQERQVAARPRRAVLKRAAIEPWVQQGAQEVVTYSFVPTAWAMNSGPQDCDVSECYRIQNPISDDLSVMRPSLFPSLCDRLAYHARHQLDLVPLVEQAPVYHPSWEGGQKSRVAIAWPQKNSGRYWKECAKETSFYDIKGLLEGMLPTGVCFVTTDIEGHSERLYHPHLRAKLVLDDKVIGSFGLLDPRAAQQYEWPSAWLIELDAEYLEQIPATPTFQSFSKMPFVTRDWAFVVPEGVKSDNLVERVKSYDWPLCQNVQVFDFYIDSQGQRSIGLEIRFQSAERSLTDEDLHELSSHIVEDFAAHFGAKLKELAE